ncbi:MAG: cytochrome c oxidase assembly protein [Alphaproteobacteria bacterium]|nr:cytochrome c oxidase assembly protein [Alphaproteobacteria bacterium]
MRKIDRNDRVLLMCVGVFVAMVGLTYASVPLYRIFCQATGFAGTPRIFAQASNAVGTGSIEVRFDANVGQDLPWDFKPENGSMRVRLGENNKAFFRARNDSAHAIVGTATFNVTPMKAAQYFNKVQCFCFTRQELKAGQFANLGVSFFVDPAIATDPATKDVTAVTLSYTFFPAKSETKTVAALVPR